MARSISRAKAIAARGGPGVWDFLPYRVSGHCANRLGANSLVGVQLDFGGGAGRVCGRHAAGNRSDATRPAGHAISHR
jgi:hypothetical protein